MEHWRQVVFSSVEIWWNVMSISFLFVQKDLEQDDGHLLVLVLKRSGILSVKIVHKVIWTIWRKRWCWNSQTAGTQFSVLQAHCPEVGSKAKAVENCRYTTVPTLTDWDFRTIISVNQLSLYGAVSEMCEECESCHDRSETHPFWKDNLIRCSCQVWSRQTYLWMMILH